MDISKGRITYTEFMLCGLLTIITACFALFFAWIFDYYSDYFNSMLIAHFYSIYVNIITLFILLPFSSLFFAYYKANKHRPLVLSILLAILALIFVSCSMPFEVYIPIILCWLGCLLGLGLRSKLVILRRIAILATLFLSLFCLALGFIYSHNLYYGPTSANDNKMFFEYKRFPELKIEESEDGDLVFHSLSNTLYSGIQDIYNKKFILDPFQAKITSLSYYFAGQHFGFSSSKDKYSPYSNDKIFAVFSNIYQLKYSPEETVLVHKDYPSLIKAEVATWGDYYYAPIDNWNWDSYLNTAIALFEIVKNDKPILVQKIIYYHPNGLIAKIKTYYLDLQLGTESAWQKGQEDLNFDTLGFDLSRKTWSSLWANQWHSEDFILTQGSELAYQINTAKTEHNIEAGLYKRLLNPEKMDYAPLAQAWQHENNFDNLLSVFGFDITKDVAISYVDEAGVLEKLNQVESEDWIELLNWAKLKTVILEETDIIREIQNNSYKFYVESEDKRLAIYYFFDDYIFLVENGPYIFDLELSE